MSENDLLNHSVSVLLSGLNLSSPAYVAVMRRQIWTMQALLCMAEMKRDNLSYGKFKNSDWAVRHVSALDELVLKPLWDSIHVLESRIGDWPLFQFLEALEVRLPEKILQRDNVIGRAGADRIKQVTHER